MAAGAAPHHSRRPARSKAEERDVRGANTALRELDSPGDLLQAGTLQLRFLGTFGMRVGDQVLEKLSTLKSQSLLAYLVLHRDRPQSRDRLATLLWGDRPEHKARQSLSTALWRIRRSLPAPGYLLSDPLTAQFDP